MRPVVIASMLALVLALVLAACSDPGGACTEDRDCGGDLVCARSGECLSPSQVRSARVTWTVRGQPASDATCSGMPSLYLLFYAGTTVDSFGYSPVPCNAGLFVVDKIARRFTSAELGVLDGVGMEKLLDAQGNVMFDLR
jgi:hypothetical protein